MPLGQHTAHKSPGEDIEQFGGCIRIHIVVQLQDSTDVLIPPPIRPGPCPPSELAPLPDYIYLYGGPAWDAKPRKRRRPPLALRMLRLQLLNDPRCVQINDTHPRFAMLCRDLTPLLISPSSISRGAASVFAVRDWVLFSFGKTSSPAARTGAPLLGAASRAQTNSSVGPPANPADPPQF
jgi:hypothetical protein